MDTQEAANLAQIENTRLSRRMVYTGYATFIVCAIGTAVAVWVAIRQPDASQPPPEGGGFMLMKWLPVILLGSSSLVVATALLVVAFRQWRFKPLRELNSRLAADLSRANTDFGNKRKQAEALQGALTRAEDSHGALKSQLSALNESMALAEEGHKAELLATKIELLRKEDELREATESATQAHKRANAAETENLRLSNELALLTPSKRLREMEDKDRVAIQDAVVLSAIQFRNETVHGFRYVDFVFSVFNQSVYPISIDSIGPGDIVFNRDEFVKAKRLQDNTAQNVEPRQDGNFTVRQYLDDGDIKAINEASDDRLFRFDNLKISIKGGTGYEDVITARDLKIDCYSLSKQYPLWRNYNIGPFQSRFNGEMTGQIREVYFQSTLDLVSYKGGHDYSYDLCFVIHVFILNHGDPKSIERFRLAIKVNGETYEGERETLAGFQVIRRDRDPQPIKDIEDDNDENLFEKRGGWLRFRVRNIKGYEEEKPPLEIELDAIDKNLEPNRLTPLPQSAWLGHAQFQESHILGSDKWAESEMKAYPENQIKT